MKKKWRHFRKAAFSFYGWIGLYSKLGRKKTMGSRGKINAIWWNIKTNLQNLVDVREYELPTDLQNFTQKDLTEVKTFEKVLVELLFPETPCTRYIHLSVTTSWRRRSTGSRASSSNTAFPRHPIPIPPHKINRRKWRQLRGMEWTVDELALYFVD